MQSTKPRKQYETCVALATEFKLHMTCILCAADFEVSRNTISAKDSDIATEKYRTENVVLDYGGANAGTIKYR